MDNVESNCISVYENLSRLPTINNVNVIQDRNNDHVLNWELNYSERNLARKTNVNYKVYGSVNSKDLTITTVPFSSESSEIISGYSKCGQMKAAVIQMKEKDEVKQYFEVWDNNSKVLTFDVAAEGEHGLVHNNPMFGCMEWSNDKTKILYIADNKPFKKTKQKCSYLTKSKDEDSSSNPRRDKYVYEDHWGEQMYNCREPTLCMIDLVEKKMINLFEYMPPGVSVAKGVWSNNDKFTVFTGFSCDPWRLGLIYCRNRQSGIYALMFKDKTLKTVVDSKDSIYSMTLSPSGLGISYLQTKSLGPHAQCACLNTIGISEEDFSFGSPVVVCNYVKKAKGKPNFQGFFVREGLPPHCWLNNNSLVFHSQNRSNISLFLLDTETSQISALEIEGEWRILAVHKNVLFASHSLPNSPQAFKIGNIKKVEAGDYKIDWVTVQKYPENLNDIAWSIMYHKPKFLNNEYPEVPFESVVVRPKDVQNIKGLIVNPHGGPHGCWSTGYDMLSACLARVGYVVLRVNYRGSTGFGQNGIDSLIGNIGSQDVADVHQATMEAIEKFNIDPKRVFVKGGSHGGFLTLHLIAQYPDVFRAAVARNPVCNIVANAVASDIPDWSYSESGLPFSYKSKPEPENYKKMLEKSPVYIADAVKTPLMLMLGGSDKRVPHYQSIEFYRIVKSNSKNKVRLLMYEDNDHRIAEVEAETDSFMNSVLWFSENSLTAAT